MTTANDVPAQDTDKVEEYFETRGVVKNLRDDLKDLTVQHEDYEELQKLTKKVKEMRTKIKEQEDIRILTEKIETLKERMELLKEIIRAQLVENAQEEVKKDGRKLRLVQILKEMRDDEDK